MLNASMLANIVVYVEIPYNITYNLQLLSNTKINLCPFNKFEVPDFSAFNQTNTAL